MYVQCGRYGETDCGHKSRSIFLFTQSWRAIKASVRMGSNLQFEQEQLAAEYLAGSSYLRNGDINIQHWHFPLNLMHDNELNLLLFQ